VTFQIEAVALAAALVVLVIAVERARAFTARRSALRARAEPAEGPYILYFSSPGCTACRTHQEPALKQLDDIRIEKVNAEAEPDLARRYSVYTLPTTVVVAADGRPLHVNYGFAPATVLRRQLSA
jgi:thioredoxin-like negative regulator of GroEL